MKVSIPTSEQWLQERKNDLERSLYHNWSEDDFPKDHQDALVSWFLEGDLEPLLTCQAETAIYSWNLTEIMSLCPTPVSEEYFRVMQEVSMWLSERGLHYWKPSRKEKRDEQFVSSFVAGAFTVGDETYYKELTHDRVKLMYTKPGDPYFVFPFSLGIDKWVPEGAIDMPLFVSKTLTKLGRYMFSDAEDAKIYLVSVELFNYILPVLNTLNEDYFALEFSKDKSIKAGQSLTRSFFSNLHGYKTIFDQEELQHRDPEMEQRVRDAFEKADMPESYHKFIEFIHEYKEKAVDPDYVDPGDEPFI